LTRTAAAPKNRGVRASEAVEVIVSVMAPYIGDTMARSAARAHCLKLGVGDTLSADEAEALLDRLGSGLNIFLGRDRSAEVLAETRLALERAGIAP
jgi:hypothetical protein